MSLVLVAAQGFRKFRITTIIESRVSGDIQLHHCLNPRCTKRWNRPQSACSPGAIKDNERASGIAHVGRWWCCNCRHVFEVASVVCNLIQGAVCDEDNVGCSCRKPVTKASGAEGYIVYACWDGCETCVIPVLEILTDDSANPCSMNSC